MSRDVVVKNPAWLIDDVSNGFMYTLAALSISSISPNGAGLTGGATIVITGGGFTTGLPASVTFGGVAGTGVTVLNPTTLSVVAPAHDAGAVDVVVHVGANSVTAASGFTFEKPGNKRRAVSPH